jgi:tRNA modification GTPase
MSDSAAASAETYVCCLTPIGTGAIACLGLHGPRAWQVTTELFRPRNPASFPSAREPKPGQFWLGRFGEEIADEVVVAVKQLHPVPSVEVHCHGGREVVELLLEVCERRGLLRCSWQEFIRRNTESPGQAAATVALVKATTVRTAAILLDQYHGAFSSALAALRDGWDRAPMHETAQRLEGLARYAPLGRHLTDPWRVVIAGAPNVGKSSLVNALAGYQRCIVAPTPGTTRDVVTTGIAVEGWPVELADTAGDHEAETQLERQGIELARATAQTADLCLWVLDASTNPSWPEIQTHALRLVVNKVDLPAVWPLEQATDAVHVSALSGGGIAELTRVLAGWLVPDPPPPGAAVPFTPELASYLERAWEYHQAGLPAASRQTVEAAWEWLTAR